MPAPLRCDELQRGQGRVEQGDRDKPSTAAAPPGGASEAALRPRGSRSTGPRPRRDVVEARPRCRAHAVEARHQSPNAITRSGPAEWRASAAGGPRRQTPLAPSPRPSAGKSAWLSSGVLSRRQTRHGQRRDAHECQKARGDRTGHGDPRGEAMSVTGPHPPQWPRRGLSAREAGS